MSKNDMWNDPMWKAIMEARRNGLKSLWEIPLPHDPVTPLVPTEPRPLAILHATTWIAYGERPRSVRPLTEADHKAMKHLSELMEKERDATLNQLLNISTNMPSGQSAVLTEDILKSMMKDIKEMRANDPLLSRGIAEDWLCIINHRTHNLLIQWSDEHTPQSWWGSRLNRINELTRRMTYVINTAPDGVEYMTELTARRLYPEFFEENDNLRIEQWKKDHPDTEEGNL